MRIWMLGVAAVLAGCSGNPEPGSDAAVVRTDTTTSTMSDTTMVEGDSALIERSVPDTAQSSAGWSTSTTSADADSVMQRGDSALLEKPVAPDSM